MHKLASYFHIDELGWLSLGNVGMMMMNDGCGHINGAFFLDAMLASVDNHHHYITSLLPSSLRWQKLNTHVHALLFQARVPHGPTINGALLINVRAYIFQKNKIKKNVWAYIMGIFSSRINAIGKLWKNLWIVTAFLVTTSFKKLNQTSANM